MRRELSKKWEPLVDALIKREKIDSTRVIVIEDDELPRQFGKGTEGIAFRQSDIEGLPVAVVLIDVNAGDLRVAPNLGHEIRHAAQILRGELAPGDGGHLWKNELIPSGTPYWTRPWEVDARRAEQAAFTIALELGIISIED